MKYISSIGQKRWHKILIALIVVAILCLGIVLASIQIWYSNNLQPLSNGKVQNVALTVESGMNSTSIGQLLESKKIIKSARAFNWYVSRTGVRAELQAGTYSFSPTQTVQRITQMLVEGEVDTSYVTILSGKRLDELKRAFIRSGFSDQQVDAGLSADQYRSHASLKDLPAGATLEGYIYPETFQITGTTTVSEVINQSLTELDNKLTPAVVSKLKAKGFSIHQAVILASIIEKETSTIKDRPIVAQVFEKRLSIDMALGSDVTYMYAAAVTGQTASPSLDSPYNTRKVKGLPPGPISNFTFSSLEAVANPSSTGYLYFVAGDDGTVHYANTFDEHNDNIVKYCHKLCN